MKVQSVDRTFDILELLSKEKNGLSLTEISKNLNLHKSTVFRLLSVLKKRGYIEQIKHRGIYKMGMEFIELCSNLLNNLELKTEANPFLRKLSMLTNQTVFLAIYQDNSVVYIDKVEQYNSLRKYSIIGQRRPLHCTALGKALLTGFSEFEIRQIYEGKTLKSFTPNTITDLSKLLDEIDKSRKRGWTLDNEEYEQGIICVGAPIKDYRDKVIAAVSTSWYSKVFPELEIEKVAVHVKEAAAGISMHMGYRSRP